MKMRRGNGSFGLDPFHPVGANAFKSTEFVVDITFSPVLLQEGNNEVGAVGPSGDFEIRIGLGEEPPMEPDLTGNTVDVGAGSSSAAQLPQKNILERKEVLIGEDTSGFFICLWKPLSSPLRGAEDAPRCLPCSFPAFQGLLE